MLLNVLNWKLYPIAVLLNSLSTNCAINQTTQLTDNALFFDYISSGCTAGQAQSDSKIGRRFKKSMSEKKIIKTRKGKGCTYCTFITNQILMARIANPRLQIYQSLGVVCCDSKTNHWQAATHTYCLYANNNKTHIAYLKYFLLANICTLIFKHWTLESIRIFNLSQCKVAESSSSDLFPHWLQCATGSHLEFFSLINLLKLEVALITLGAN